MDKPIIEGLVLFCTVSIIIVKSEYFCVNSFAEMNNSTVILRCSLSSPSIATKIVLTVVYAVIAIIALLGNCAIITIAKTRKRIRKVPFNFFIISLAVADIFDALVSVPISVLVMYSGDRWFGGLIGDITCKLVHFFNMVSLTASVFTLIALSADRYLAIAHVFRKPLSKRHVKLVVLLLWLLAAAPLCTVFIKYRVHGGNKGYKCFGRWSDDLETNLRYYKIEVGAKFTFFYVVPLLLMAVMYFLTILVLKKRQVFVENMSQVRVQAQNVAVIKMLVSVVFLFAFCWIPNYIALFMIAFAYNKLECWPLFLVWSLFVPSHVNGAINPCIYLVFNESYRKGLKRLLASCLKQPAVDSVTKRTNEWSGFSTLERDPSRRGIKGFFRDLSKKTSESDEVTYETRF